MNQEIPITRCPHCQTTFRVRPAQLQASNGRVRCGSCLQIFSAPENEVTLDAVDTGSPEPASQGTATPESDSTDAFGSPAENPDRESHARADEPLFPSDEPDWGNHRFNAPDTDDRSHRRPPQTPPHSEPAEDDASAHTQEPVFPEGRPDASTSSSEPGDDPQVPTVRNRFEQARAHLDTLSANYGSQRRRRRLWRSAAVGLILLLILQLGWWQRATLAGLPVLSSAYAPLCSVVDCGLSPAAPSAQALQTLSSSLRINGEDSLRLDAVFVNRGERPQPFPDVIVTLQSMQGERIADGRFRPDDYLGTDPDPNRQLMPGRPVSISLPMNRPVSAADNFEILLTY